MDIDWIIIQGSITKAYYLEFIRQCVLPPCDSSASGFVLVMDNAAIYRDPELLQMCAEKGVQTGCLPPFSPDSIQLGHLSHLKILDTASS